VRNNLRILSAELKKPLVVHEGRVMDEESPRSPLGKVFEHPGIVPVLRDDQIVVLVRMCSQKPSSRGRVSCNSPRRAFLKQEIHRVEEPVEKILWRMLFLLGAE